VHYKLSTDDDKIALNDKMKKDTTRKRAPAASNNRAKKKQIDLEKEIIDSLDSDDDFSLFDVPPLPPPLTVAQQLVQTPQHQIRPLSLQQLPVQLVT